MTTARQVTAPVLLIGNAPVEAARNGAAALAPAARAVVRINDAFGFGGVHGERTSHLVLVNCGGSMRERLENPARLFTPALRAAERVILPIAPQTDDLRVPPVPPAARLAPDARNYAPEASARLEAANKRVATLPARFFAAAARAAGHERLAPDTPPPSTGLIALVWLLEAYPAAPIHCFGFAFEGWEGHAWAAERAFFARQAEAGRVRLHAVA